MSLLVDITTRCNMRCAHCMWDRTSDGEDMTLDTFARTLDILPPRGRGVMSLGTAEPTVHPLFWEIVDMALEHGGWTIRVVTNGKRKRHAIRLAEMAKSGTIQAHLSQDEWHDPISEEVVAAFVKDPTDPRDMRAHRTCHTKDLRNFGRCDFGDPAEGCRCPIARVKVDGSICWCGCEGTPVIGNVFDGWDEGKLLDARRFCRGGDHSSFFRGIAKDMRGKKRYHDRSKLDAIASLVELSFDDVRFFGSYGRGMEKCSDLDALVVDRCSLDVVDVLRGIGAHTVREKKHKVAGFIGDVLVELWPCGGDKLAAGSLYLNGPYLFNAWMRSVAKEQGMKLDFDGLWIGDELMECDDERQIFEKLGIEFVPVHDRNGWRK